MAEILDFDRFDGEPDPRGLSREELREYLASVRKKLDALDETEPADLESEAAEAWLDRHEDLEDLTDEIMDLLDE